MADRGKKGEFLVHLAADIKENCNEPAERVLVPDDLNDHVDQVSPLPVQVLTDDEVEGQSVNYVKETVVVSELDAQQPPNCGNLQDEMFHKFIDATVMPKAQDSHHESIEAAEMPSDAPAAPEVKSEEVPENVQTDLTAEGEVKRDLHVEMPKLSRITKGKIKDFIRVAQEKIKQDEDILASFPVREFKKKVKIWEVFAGEGRVTNVASRHPDVEARRFSLHEGWDFTKVKHRAAFIKLLIAEEPDAVLISPMCKLWSNLQELTIASHPEYEYKLEQMRQLDHDEILMFTATVYEIQRRNGRLGLCEHPERSRAWKTEAFQRMKGYDVPVDQCCYGLKLVNDWNEMLPVKKPTTFRVTGPLIRDKLMRRCDGSHRHTPLEGSIPGVGLRSKLAENYPHALAVQIVKSILYQLEHDDDVLAIEEAEERQDAEAPPDAVAVQPDPIQKNRQLRAKVGGRAVDYVQRLHKNLGHPSNDVLKKMLTEIQATENVLEAAQNYTCPICYARKPPAQTPPSHALRCTEFNDRIQVDSHWIQCEESIVRDREPAPGTPAAKRREKKALKGRQCVLTIVDHATRYCAIRILQSEKAEELTKGLERAWIKHFGVPRLIRLDEAKGWTSKHVREWTSSRGIALEVQPAENHSWLGVVERKHQVIRRALETYQDQIGRHDLSSLKEAAIYVPHAVNQLSIHKGFSPQQWVLGKQMTYAHGLSGEIFNPSQEALDEQGAFAQVQLKRANAAKAFIAADTDAKLRRAFNQKFIEVKDDLVVGQQCWFWRNAGAGVLQKSRWRGPARIVAVEELEDVKVFWLCHGTSLIRCSPRQVRPLVEETGVPAVPDRRAALRDLEELKARSTTQFQDEMRKSGNMPPDDIDIEAEYEDDYVPEDPVPEGGEVEESEVIPGVVRMFFPQLALGGDDRDRERSPRRRISNESTAPPSAIADPDGQPSSPKRQAASSSEQPPSKQPRAEGSESVSHAEVPTEGHIVPVPDDDDEDLMVDAYFVEESVKSLPEGWCCVDGGIELDDVFMAALRKGEVNERKLNPNEQAEFVSAKRAELEQFFANDVWTFAHDNERDDAINKHRVITARWVLTWKCISEPNEAIPRYRAKARLVLRGFEDPDLLSMKTASPTASRMSRTYLLATANWNDWMLICADVKAAFLSGSSFDRVIVVRLPMDCTPLLGPASGAKKSLYMKMKKSAYGLADAPLMWYKEASSRLARRGWKKHPLDQCCFLLPGKDDSLCGMLILHVDDMLICGGQSNEFQTALSHLKKDFNFGKCDILTPQTPLKYCGGVILKTSDGIEMSFKDYIQRICPITIGRGRKETDVLTEHEKSKGRALIGALQWPASQGMPMLSATMSLSAGMTTVKDLMELNKALRFAKANADVTIKALARPAQPGQDMTSVALICFADAAFSVRKDLTSQGGFLIVATDSEALAGKKRPATTISWRSFKLPRVCRSSLAAECQACSTSLEELLMMKTYLEILKRPRATLTDVKDDLKGNCAMVTDCKALFDAVYRETVQQATDKRVAIECLVIKDLLHDLKCDWRWVSSERQLADGLTKTGARQNFVERYTGSFVQLVADETYTASKKKSREERQRTVLETRGSRSTVAQALIGLVMADQVCSSTAMTKATESENVDGIGFLTILVTLVVGLLTFGIFFGRWCASSDATVKLKLAQAEIAELKIQVKEKDEQIEIQKRAAETWQKRADEGLEQTLIRGAELDQLERKVKSLKREQSAARSRSTRNHVH